MHEHGFTESHDALLDTWYRAFEKHEVVLDLAVTDETAHSEIMLVEILNESGSHDLRCDVLLADIGLCACIALIRTFANAVNLVVDGGTVMVAHLTSTSDCPLHVRRMPGTDTSDLPQTLMGLAWKLLGAPSARHTLKAVTLGDGDAVDHFILLEDGVDLHRLLEEVMTEVDLVGDRATIHLDLHQVRLLLLERSLADLCVGEDADDGAVLLHTLEFAGDAFAGLVCMLLRVLGKGLLLALVPVLVKSSLHLVREVLSPDSSQRAEAAGCLDVADQSNHHHLLECTDQRMPSMVLAPSLVPEEFR